MTTSIRRYMKPWKKERARQLRKNPTPAEAKLWESLRCRRLMGLKFTRQNRLLGYIVDLYCPALKLVVEVDGSSHAHKADQDARRDAQMAAYGFTVIRVTNSEVFGGLAVRRIREAITTNSGRALPLPQRLDTPLAQAPK